MADDPIPAPQTPERIADLVIMLQDYAIEARKDADDIGSYETCSAQQLRGFASAMDSAAAVLSAQQERIGELDDRLTNLHEDGCWRHSWHHRLGRGLAEPEGKFYERMKWQQERIAALEQELEEAKADATDWLLCMDGIKHDPRCANHFMGDPRNGPCLRCKADSLQQAEATLARVRALRKQWREESAAVDHASAEALVKRFGTLMDPDGYTSHCLALEACADDLDHALAGEAGEQENKK